MNFLLTKPSNSQFLSDSPRPPSSIQRTFCTSASQTPARTECRAPANQPPSQIFNFYTVMPDQSHCETNPGGGREPFHPPVCLAPEEFQFFLCCHHQSATVASLWCLFKVSGNPMGLSFHPCYAFSFPPKWPLLVSPTPFHASIYTIQGIVLYLLFLIFTFYTKAKLHIFVIASICKYTPYRRLHHQPSAHISPLPLLLLKLFTTHNPYLVFTCNH